VQDARSVVARLADQVELWAVDGRRVRAVTHLDVSADDIDRAVALIAGAI
jgi:threonine aldolase